MLRLFCLLCAIMWLAACSSNKEKEEDKVAKLVKFTNTISVDRVWKASSGSSSGRRYKQIVPIVVNDVVYSADATGAVFAFHKESGKRLWKTDLDVKISGATGAGFGLVMVGTIDADVVAIDATNGEVKWTSKASSEVLSAPATNGSIVVAQTIDGRVFAYDAKTGETRWSYDHLTPILSLRGTSGPVVTTTQVICAFDNGQIVSFSALDGSRLWEARVAQPKGKTDLERIVDIEGNVVVDSGVVYAVSYQGNVAALARGKGNPIWSKTASSFYPVAVDQGKVFVSTDKSKVIAYNAASGDVLWENNQLQNREINGPAVIGDYVAVIDKDDYMHVMSQQDGSFVYRFKPKGDKFKSPMVSDDGKLYILSDDSVLSVYEVGK
ncbi:MAG: outer membrane protein assembly factor BamB [Lentisphaeria bacterium]|jgi:outer membrane protein assembly factor BamB